jgi:hypothetical protein
VAVLHLRVPYADSEAAMLGFALGLPVLRSLGELTVDAPAGRGTGLSLRLLGASHQVLVDTGAGRFTETVACHDGVPAGVLPARVARTVCGALYTFHAEVRRVDADVLRHAADALRERLAGRRHALVGVFPGSPDAITALLADPVPDRRAVRWQTWHVYPRTGEIAHTHSEVRVRRRYGGRTTS